MRSNKTKFLGMLLGALCYTNINAQQATICLTGKLELIFPNYKAAFLNAANLALTQSANKNTIQLRTYFYDNKPLSPIRVYRQMVKDQCSAIVGFEYLSDLLLVTKIQKDTKIPIFTSYASSNDADKLPKNIFMFMPTYNFHAKKMLAYLHEKYGEINNVLVITEIDRDDLYKYNMAYKNLLDQGKIHYDSLDFIGNDDQFGKKLSNFISDKKYKFVFVLSSAVGSTKIINIMNDHQVVFIGTENFGSSTNQSLYERLNDKKVMAFSIRNIDSLKQSKIMAKFAKDYKLSYSIDPFPLSVYTYDALAIILQTLKKTGSINTENILLNNFNGVSGARIKDGVYYRSDDYVILSVGESGFVYEK